MRRRTVFAWLAAAVAGILVVAVIAVLGLLHSARFHRYLLRAAERMATEAVGAPVSAQDFVVRPSRLRVDFYGVQVLGANGHPTPPVLTVEHIGLRIRIVSLFRREWYLQNLVFDRPVAYVLVDAQGNSNLPQPPSTGNTDLFTLGVRHARLDGGELYYNNRKSPLEADLRDLALAARFDPAQTRYSGTLSYREGRLQFGGYNPIAHDLDVSFQATPKKLTVSRGLLVSGPSPLPSRLASRLAFAGTWEDYRQPNLHMTYSALVSGEELRRVTKNSSLPVGMLQLQGVLAYRSEPHRPPLELVRLEGDLSSAGLGVNMDTPDVRTDIRELSAHYRLFDGNLEVSPLRARLLGGLLNGSLSIRNLAGPSEGRLQAVLRGLSAAELQALAGRQGNAVRLGGTGDAELEAAWSRKPQDWTAGGNLILNGTVAPAKAAAAPFPVNAVLHGRYAAGRRELTLTQSQVRLPQTQIWLDGTVSQRSRLQVRLQSDDLRELDALAAGFRPSAASLDLAGQGFFQGTVEGSTASPLIQGQLTATNLRLRDTLWRLVRTDLSLSPSEAVLQNAVLEPADTGRARFDARFGLQQWRFTSASPFRLQANVARVPVAPVLRAAGLRYPVEGLLSGDLSAQGTERNPVGQGTLHMVRGSIGEEPLPIADATFQGTGEQVNVALLLRSPAGLARGNLRYYPQRQAYEGTLQANGVNLNQVVAARRRQVSGLLNVQLTGQGTIDNPTAQLTLTTPQLQWAGRTVNAFRMQANLQGHVVALALDSQLTAAYLRVHGNVDITDDYNAQLSLDTSNFPLQPLLAAYLPKQAPGINGRTEVHATLQGPLRRPALWDAHIAVPVLSLTYDNNLQLAVAEPLHADYAQGVLQVRRTEIRGTGTDMQIEGAVPLRDNRPGTLRAAGTADLQLIKLLWPDARGGGQLRFDLHSFGTITRPDFEGQVQVVNASLQTPALPLGLENGNGSLTLHNGRIDVNQLQGALGSGTLQLSGGVVYYPNLQFDLAMRARGVRLLYPEGVRSQVDGDLALTGTPDFGWLRGTVLAQAVGFTSDFDLVSLARQFTNEGAPPPPIRGLSENLHLQVAVQSATGLAVTSRTLSLQGTANLRLVGTLARPVITGRMNLTGGDLIFLSNRYVIQDGALDFVSATRTEPVVNLRASTTISQYNINLILQGPAERMRTTYTSTPSLPPADIIHLIAFGNTSEAAAQSGTTTTLGAESLVANTVSSQLTSNIAKIAGISQLSFNPNLGGVSNYGPSIAVQQRVTSKLYVTFVSDLASAQYDQVQVQYEVSPRWSVSTTRDQNGGFGFDARYHKTF